MIDRRIKHGMGGRKNRAPEFNVWCKMRERCGNPKNKDFKNYGARGITVCKRWMDFAAFIFDMGPRPSNKHTIERVDNDLGYSPENCTWATRKEQNNNRRPRARQNSCQRGHDMTGENVYLRPDGKRGCKECRRINMRNFYARKKEHVCQPLN